MSITILFEDYGFREAGLDEFNLFVKEHKDLVFADFIDLTSVDWMSNEQKQLRSNLQVLIADRFVYRLFILKGTEIIGWHVSNQIDEKNVRMGNTGILKTHQGRGIYTSLLPHIIQTLRQKGFQLISSKHHASNNRVLIPKLKAGFQITGMEIDDRYGIFVVLSYYLSERRLQFYHFRTGFQRPNEEIKKHL